MSRGIANTSGRSGRTASAGMTNLNAKHGSWNDWLFANRQRVGSISQLFRRRINYKYSDIVPHKILVDPQLA